MSYKAKVDPSFTQAASNPLAVTYSYSADATSTVNGVSTDLATTGQLPSGVLNFYSPVTPGQPAGLVCSMNVGGTVTGGSCLVNYTTTGSVAVTTEYIPSGVPATTQTDLETISPYATSTAESITAGVAGCGTQPAFLASETIYSCSYTIGATVADENGATMGEPVTFTFSDSAGDQIVVSAPANHPCAVTVYETTYTGTQAMGGSSPYQSSKIAPGDCGGGGQLDQRAVPSWSVAARFTGTAGYAGSGSPTGQVTAY